ncbi:hypothetical protein [Trichothermofontia sp.]
MMTLSLLLQQRPPNWIMPTLQVMAIAIIVVLTLALALYFWGD